MMKKILGLLLIFFGPIAFADGPLYLQNLQKNSTGTTSGSHNALDVNIASGTIVVNNPAVGPTGSSVPSSGDYVAGNKSGLLTGLLIGQQTMANSLACVLPSDQSAIPVNQGTANATPWNSNTAQINGTTPLMGNGAAGSGAQRVTIASDNTAFSVNATLQAGSAIAGKVGIDQTTVGTTNGVSLAQVGTATILTGNGTTGAGAQRVTIASDNTAFSVNAIPKTPTAVTVKQAAITIGTTAIRLTNDGLVPPSTRVLLVAQLLSTSTANCYFGSSSVTTTSTTRGVQMFAGQTLSFSRDAGDYYGICDAVSQTVFITEQE